MSPAAMVALAMVLLGLSYGALAFLNARAEEQRRVDMRARHLCAQQRRRNS